MKDALAATITTLPEQLRRSLTWDRGKETRPARPVQDRHRHRRSTSPTRTAPGSAARTRTPTGCCASTSPRAPTSRAGPPRTSKPSPPRSTTDPARPSAGRHPPKPSTSTYCRSNKPVLRRPVESGQYTSWIFGHRLRAAGLLGSMGRVASSWTTPSSSRSGRPCSASCSTGNTGRAATSSPRRSSSGSKPSTTQSAATPPSPTSAPHRLRRPTRHHRNRGMITTSTVSAKACRAPNIRVSAAPAAVRQAGSIHTDG